MGSYIFKFTEKFDFDRLKDVFEAVQGVITNGIYLLKETFIRVVTVHKERKRVSRSSLRMSLVFIDWLYSCV